MRRTKARRARARRATSTRGWAKAAPKTATERRAAARRCGAYGAFLDGKNLRYPIVSKSAKGAGSCRIDCRALRSALSRASQQHDRRMVARARQLGSRLACEWAR